MKKVNIFGISLFQQKKYNCMFESLLKQYQITQIEIDVLAFLYNNPQFNHAQDIVDIRGISKGHVSLAIEKLTQKNLLERKPDSNNRRCNILVLKQEAHEIIQDILQIQAEYQRTAYQGFTEEEFEQYKDYLSRIYTNLGGKDYE